MQLSVIHSNRDQYVLLVSLIAQISGALFALSRAAVGLAILLRYFAQSHC